MVKLCNLIENGGKKKLEQAENGDHDWKMVSSRKGRVASPPPTIELFTTKKQKMRGLMYMSWGLQAAEYSKRYLQNRRRGVDAQQPPVFWVIRGGTLKTQNINMFEILSTSIPTDCEEVSQLDNTGDFYKQTECWRKFIARWEWREEWR